MCVWNKESWTWNQSIVSKKAEHGISFNDSCFFLKQPMYYHKELTYSISKPNHSYVKWCHSKSGCQRYFRNFPRCLQESVHSLLGFNNWPQPAPPPKKIWLLKRRKFIGYPQKHPQVGPGCRLAMVIWQVAVGHQHQLIFAIQVMGFLADLKPIYPQFVFWNQGKGENQIQPSRLQIIALHALPQAPLVWEMDRMGLWKFLAYHWFQG